MFGISVEHCKIMVTKPAAELIMEHLVYRGGTRNVGQGCCQGLRLKRRKFTFECSDGTSFAEEVEKPSKCGCALCA